MKYYERFKNGYGIVPVIKVSVKRKSVVFNIISYIFIAAASLYFGGHLLRAIIK